MAGGLRHAFESGKADGGDATLVRPSNWNAPHVGFGFNPFVVPATPNAADEEFDAALSGFTNRNSAVSDANVVSSIMRVSKTGAVFDDLVGADKAMTMGTDGDTVTIGIRSFKLDANYQGIGLYVMDSTPANGQAFCYIHDGTTGGYFQRVTYTGLSTVTAQANYTATDMPDSYYPALPLFMRIVRNSSTSYDFQFSFSGIDWITAFAAFNPGFTIDRVGICATSLTNTVDTFIAVDFLRKNWTP